MAIPRNVRTVGLISDTHGLLRPEALHALAGCELIIHAGDVGKQEILTELARIAPVIAVRGNVDTEPWALELPETAIAQAGATQIYVLHNLQDLDLNPAAAGFHVVVSGHTHQFSEETKNGVLYINPGSAGPRRFKLPITLARLHVHGNGNRIDRIEIVDSQTEARKR